MPTPSLWRFEVDSSNLLHVFRKDKQLKGAIIDIHCHSLDGQDHLLIVTSADPKSGRPLKPDFFQWSANTITRIFRGCQTAEKFVAVWKREIVPYLNPKNGELDVRTMKLSQQTNESTRNNRKRPATDSEPQETTKKMKDVTETDKEIETYYIGRYDVPLRCMREPSNTYRLRDLNPAFIQHLKDEMRVNPVHSVSPLIGMITVDSDEEIDSNHIEGYTFETLGGNHSRAAMEQLADESTDFADKLKECTVDVYRPMPVILAKRLARRHNRATSFTHGMTTQDKIATCRNHLYSLAGKNEAVDETPERSTKWKEDWIAVLFLDRQHASLMIT